MRDCHDDGPQVLIVIRFVIVLFRAFFLDVGVFFFLGSRTLTCTHVCICALLRDRTYVLVRAYRYSYCKTVYARILIVLHKFQLILDKIDPVLGLQHNELKNF